MRPIHSNYPHASCIPATWRSTSRLSQGSLHCGLHEYLDASITTFLHPPPSDSVQSSPSSSNILAMSLISIRLPWEVIERVIEHAYDDLDLLRSFSLTCKQLRPRSFALIIAHHVFLDSRDRVSAFSGFIGAEKKLQPFVRSIIISPADFRPFPLVNMLPHLSTLLFVSPGYHQFSDPHKRPPIVLHSTVLKSYHSFGKNIHTLSLDRLSFPTSSNVFRFILAFPRTTKIVCHDIIVKSQEKNTSTTELLRTRLCNRLRLETLNVSIQDKPCAIHFHQFADCSNCSDPWRCGCSSDYGSAQF